MNSLANWFTQEVAPYRIVSSGVNLEPLSSKCDSTFVDDRVQGKLLASILLCPVYNRS